MMDIDWPPLVVRRKCRCQASPARRAHACRSRPSRHCARSWVAAPPKQPKTTTIAASGQASGQATGCGSGVCPAPGPGPVPRPASAEPAPRPHHPGARPATAPGTGQGQGRGSRRRGAGLRSSRPPALPESPEEQLDSWSCSSIRLAATLKGVTAAVSGDGVLEAGAAAGKAQPCPARAGARGSPLDDEIEAHDSLREKLAADVMGPDWSADWASSRPRAVDDASVRSVTAASASAAASSIATNTSGTSMTATTATSRTASLLGEAAPPPAPPWAPPWAPHGARGHGPGRTDEDADADALATRMFQDDSQGSDIILPVHIEAGTDPVAELELDVAGGAPIGKNGGWAEPTAGSAASSAETGRRRARTAREPGRRRMPARLRVPLYEYHPALQAMHTSPGRPRPRSQADGGAHRTLAARAREPRGRGSSASGRNAEQDRLEAADDDKPRGLEGTEGKQGRRRRLERLAKPNPRHDRRARRADLQPNLSVGPDPIWPISKAALRALPTPRVSRLSIAPARRSEVRTTASRSRAASTYSTGSVTSRLSARLEELSKPRLSRARAARAVTGRASGAGGAGAASTSNEWRRHEAWLQINAQPRKDHSLSQRKVRRGRSTSLRRLLPRLRVLAKPSQRALVKPSEPQLKTVSQSALRYQASERIIRLSQPLQRRLSIIQ